MSGTATFSSRFQELPKHWGIKRFRFLGFFQGGGTPSKENQDFWNGDIPWVSPKDMKTYWVDDSEDHITEAGVQGSATKILPPNCLLIVVRSGILQHTIPVAINTRPVALNQDMKGLISQQNIEARYYRYYISGNQNLLLTAWRKIGATVDSIDFDLMRNTLMPVPPLPEQSAIADFLDRKTRAIDDLIQKKERLIELLQEKRQALITQAVTKGLDPTVPMKDSGIEWLGKIPAHWAQTTIKRVCLSVRDGTHNPPPRADGEHRLLSARNIQNGAFILRDDDRTMTEDAFDELERSYTIREGDVVVAIVGATTGKSAVVGPVEKVSVQRSIAILRPNPAKTTSEYLNAWVIGDRLQHEIQLVASKYAAQGGIYLEDLANLTCALPPQAEQHKILYWLAPRFDKIDTTADRLQQQIDRLREYRQALISAVVTGKIDVVTETT